MRWCEKNLRLAADRVLVVDSSDKALFSHPGAILVDDRKEYRTGWEARGGIFIHFTEVTVGLRMNGLKPCLRSPLPWRGTSSLTDLFIDSTAY